MPNTCSDTDSEVAVIGAGLAGLACALTLADRGVRVTLLEKAAVAGGRAGSERDLVTGDTVDLGPHILLSEYRNMRALLKRLGTEQRIVWNGPLLHTLVDGHTQVSARSYPLPPPLHFFPSLLRAPQLSLRDLASNARVTWQAMKYGEREVARLDAIDAETYLRNSGVRPQLIQWYWATLSMSILNVPLDRCSAGALFRFYRLMIGRNDLRLGFAGDGLAEIFVPQALAALADAGAQVRLNSPVAGIARKDEGEFLLRLSSGQSLSARACVAALPPNVLYDLLPEAWRQAHAGFGRLREFVPSPYISTYLWFDRKLTHSRAWARTYAPEKLNCDSYDLSNIRLGWSGRPSVIASNIVYSYRAHHLSDTDIVAATRRELAEIAPTITHARLLHARVHRVPMAIPAPHPGTEHLRLPQATPVPNFFVAGDWTRTGLPASMESAVRAGLLAAEAVLDARGRIAQPVASSHGIVRIVRRAAAH